MKTHAITQNRLKEVLDYDPSTGVFTWSVRSRGIRFGARAGCVDPTNGYREIRIDGVAYRAQRLAWLWVHGTWPRLIRFQNEDHDDCRIENLREGFYLKTKHDWRTAEGRSAYQLEYRAERRDVYRQKERERKFGLSLAEYAAVVAEQDNKCAICRRAETETRNGKVKALAVDHDHETGKVRALLCVACNTGLGKFGDDRERLLSAIRYLDKHSEARNVVTLGVKERK